MKKIVISFIVATVFAAMAFSVSAADVYVNDGGTGDGTTAQTAMGSLYDAFVAIADDGGTVHIVETYTSTDVFVEPEHSAPITVTGGEFVFQCEKNRWYLNGATTFENIKITETNVKNGAVIAAQFNPIVIGENVITPEKTYLLGGHQIDGMKTDTEAALAAEGKRVDQDSFITIKSGTFHVVSGFSRGASDAVYTGTSHINFEGGKINLLLGGSCNGSTATNAEINVSGGEISTLYTSSNQAYRLNGDCVVNISGGTVNNLALTNIMGKGTVNISGGIVAAASKSVADDQYLIDGTVTLNILDGAEVHMVVSNAFDVVNGEISIPKPPVVTEAVVTTAEQTTVIAETTESAEVVESPSDGGFNPAIVVVIVVVVAVIVAVAVILKKKK
ncbi:MAG: hypothetical protein E7598_06920 [Ruminococcaceae bacterium]|nr:hypothetical protein [Oscillospiraceae bacterium]